MAQRKTQLDKIVLIGDGEVGKTDLMNIFVEGHTSQTYKPTIGADFRSKQITTPKYEHTLQIWDTAGQERFQSLGRSFFKMTDAVLVCFALDDKKSFDNVQKHIDEFKILNGNDGIPIFLVGTKSDLTTDIQVNRKMIDAKKRELGIEHYVETSAVTKHNVEYLFETIAHKLEKTYTATNQESPAIDQNAAKKAIEQIVKKIRSELKDKKSPLKTGVLTSTILKDDQGKKQRIYRSVQKINKLCQQAEDPQHKLTYVEACYKIHNIIYNKELRLGNSRWDKLILAIRKILDKICLGVKPMQRSRINEKLQSMDAYIPEVNRTTLAR